jgi:hypothetical protein
MNIRLLTSIVAGAILLIMAGCQRPEESSAWTKISELEDERAYLKQTITDLRRQNEQIKEQFVTLSNLDRDIRIEALASIDRITIDKRSGFFDKDDDGTEETLITYIKTYDDAGDVIKMAGDVNLQLWDLSKGKNEALLGEWNVEAKELKKLWMGMMMTNYYRISYKIPHLLNDKQKELTIKVKFTDYLTGKIFTEQKVVKRNQ